MHVKIVLLSGDIINLIVYGDDTNEDSGMYHFNTDAGKCIISSDNIESISFKK